MNAAWELLAARCAAVPALLQSMLEPDAPLQTSDALQQVPGSDAQPAQTLALQARRADLRWAQGMAPGRRFVTTGVGTSEGPARLLAHLLSTHAGADARFVPLSALAEAAARAGAAAPPGALSLGGADSVLVVFSQGLSPNAQLALAPAARFAALLVYTSVPETDPRVRGLRDRGAVVTVIPPVGPEGEDRLFLRVLGPAAAQLAAVQLADAIAARRGVTARLPIAQAVQAAQAAPQRAQAAIAQFAAELIRSERLTATELQQGGLGALWQRHPALGLALITSGGYGEHCLGLRWKFLEGAGLSEPSVWDVLQVAHGPFQQTFHRPLLLCALSCADAPLEPALLARLAAMLPPHHLFLQLPVASSGPLSLLAHDTACNELLLSVLRGRDWDLLDWPGRHCDGPLYSLAGLSDLQPHLPRSAS